MYVQTNYSYLQTMISAASDVYGRLHSVSACCSRSDRLIMGDE